MAESYSVKAVLSAQDKNFSSVFGGAQSTAERLGSTLKGGLGFGVLSSIGSKAVDAVSSGITGMIGDLSESSAAWKTFQSTMGMNGHANKEIESVKKELQDFAEKTIYSSSDMASTFAQLDAVGTKNTKDLVKGFGGLAAAAADPQQAMKTLSQQATQMAAKPKVAWEDFKLLVEQTPAGIAAVAKSMGMSTQEMIAAVQDGEIATEDFFEAITKTGTNADFSRLATEYKTVGQAMDGLTETASNKLAPAFDELSDIGISAVSAISDKIGALDLSWLADSIPAAIDTIAPYWEAIQADVSAVGAAFGEAFSAIGSALGELNGAFGSTESIQSFSDVIGTAADALTTFAGFLKEHADTIAQVITKLPALLAAYKGFQIVKALAPGLSAFAGGVLKLASGGVGGIAGKLFGVAAGETAAGTAGKTSSKQMLAAAQSFALMGVAVLAISAGFALLAQSAIQLANAGPLAIGVMVGLVAALAGLGAGMTLMLNSIQPGPKKLQAISAAMLAMGAAVVLVAAGFAILASSAVQLANAGPLAIGVMAGLVLALAGLAAGAAVIGPALTAGAVGFVAFGAAIALVGVGALAAAAALSVVAGVLPVIVQYGGSGAGAITALAGALTLFAGGAALAGAACAVLAVGLAGVGAGAAAAAIGAAALSVAVLAVGAGLTLVSVNAALLTALLPVLAAGAQAAAAGFGTLLASTALLDAALLANTVSTAAFDVAILAAAVEVIAFGTALGASAVGAAALAAALDGSARSVKSISKNAKAAEKSLSAMEGSVDVVQSCLDGLGDMAKSAMDSLTRALDRGASQAKRAGKQLGDGLRAGVQAGTSQLPSLAAQSMSRFNGAISAGSTKAVAAVRTMSASLVSALNSGSSGANAAAKSLANGILSRLRSASGGAYSAGVNIGRGLAEGMRSQLSRVRSAAAALASAAERAIRLAAKIHSPSRVSDQLGRYWGQGFADGIQSMGRKARDASEALVSIPDLVSGPDLSLDGYRGSLSEEYEYTRNAQYTIIVPVEVDGRELAHVTAPYTEAELNRRQTRDSRKRGIR